MEPRTNVPEASGRLARGGTSLWRDAWRRLMRDRFTKVCLAVIALYALVALGGVAYDILVEMGKAKSFTDMNDYDHVNEAPTTAQGVWSILGTDWAGKSVLVKTLLGAKVSLTVGFLANLIAVPLGMILGAMAGYYGGWIDDVIVWLYSTISCIPGIILLIALKYAFQDKELFVGHWYSISLAGMAGLVVALGVVSWVGTCRLIRAEVMKVRELDYVLAARAIGRGNFSILLRHVLPNVMHIGIINFSLGFVGAVGAEVTLSYLGLGVAVGTPSWGTMINAARMDLYAFRYWELTSAVVAMFFLVLALNIFGDRLRDAFDPRLKTA